MLKKQLQNIIEYNIWANKEIESYCLSNFGNNIELYTKDVKIPFNNIRNTLCHMWFAEQLWFTRMINATHRTLKIPYNTPRTITNKEFISYWKTGDPLEGRFDKFFDGIEIKHVFYALYNSNMNWSECVNIYNDHELMAEFEYYDTKGRKYTSIRSDIITHIVNHGTHHRGQISGSFTQLLNDCKPINLDMPYWQRNKDIQTEITTNNTLQ